MGVAAVFISRILLALSIDSFVRNIMSIQEISVSNNQKKMLLKAIKKEAVLFQEENGDLVVNVAAYIEFKEDKDPAPIEAIVSDVLDFESEYFVFS